MEGSESGCIPTLYTLSLQHRVAYLLLRSLTRPRTAQTPFIHRPSHPSSSKVPTACLLVCTKAMLQAPDGIHRLEHHVLAEKRHVIPREVNVKLAVRKEEYESTQERPALLTEGTLTLHTFTTHPLFSLCLTRDFHSRESILVPPSVGVHVLIRAVCQLREQLRLC